MCTKEECEKYVGQWVHFRTKYGYHVGLVERVTNDSAVVLSPKQYIPAQFASANLSADEEQRLDLALAWWGGMGRGGYPGYGGAPGAGAYGGGWGWGWRRWAVSFLIIYVLWGLWW